MKRTLAMMPLAILALVMASCVSTKKIVYFQGADSVFAQAQQIMQQYEMKLKPADQILIKLTCSEPDLLTVFAQDVVMGTAGAISSYNLNSSGSIANAYAYTVTNDGYVVLPSVGRVKVEGLTSDEAAKAIENAIKESRPRGDGAPPERARGRDGSRENTPGGEPHQRAQLHPGRAGKVR